MIPTTNILAIDIGGTKIDVCIFNENAKLVSSRIVATEKFSKGSLKFVDDIAALIGTSRTPEVSRVTIAMKGMIRDGVFIQGVLLGGRVDYPFASELSTRCGLPVSVDNDVVCMTRAEAAFGNGKNVDNFALVNMGTGIRLGFVLHGDYVAGVTNNAGEISEMLVIVPELDNRAVKIDDVLSGKGLSLIYEKLTGCREKAETIWGRKHADAAHGDAADKTIHIFATQLAYLFGTISYFYNPEKIIITGGVRNSVKWFLPEAIEMYKKQTFDFFYPSAIEISTLDHQAAMGSLLLK